MIKLVAFDWNGTLLSDTLAALDADNHVLEIFGHPKVSLLTFQKHFTIPIVDYWVAIGLSKKEFLKNYKKINDTFNKNYFKRAAKCRTRGGSKALLIWLKRQKIKTVIYSNHLISDIEKHLARLKIKKHIGHIIARHDADQSHMNHRSKGQKLAEYVKSLNLKKQEVLTVGDTEEEIEIGKKNGFHTVGLTGGYNTAARLKKHQPDFLIHNMLELKKIVQNINNS